MGGFSRETELEATVGNRYSNDMNGLFEDVGPSKRWVVKSEKQITVRALAKLAGVSPMTVSRALRNHPEVGGETARRVQELARKHGYQTNPLVGAVMRRMRAGDRVEAETLAVVWAHALDAGERANPWRKRLLKGVRLRAEQFGFAVEEWAHDPLKMSDARLSQIFYHRGIRALLLLPAYPHPSVPLEFEWQHFAAATVGHGPMSDRLHRATHDHYAGMETALLELVAAGCKRPGAVFPPDWDAFVHRRYSASFFANSNQPREAVFAGDFNSPEFPAWLKAGRYDALIANRVPSPDQAARLRLNRPRSPKIVSLHWLPDDAPSGGIDQMPERVTAAAIDLILGQMSRFESGIPDYPKTVLVPGEWRKPGALQ